MFAELSVADSDRTWQTIHEIEDKIIASYKDQYGGSTPIRGSNLRNGYHLLDSRTKNVVLTISHDCDEELVHKHITIHAFGAEYATVAEKVVALECRSNPGLEGFRVVLVKHREKPGV